MLSKKQLDTLDNITNDLASEMSSFKEGLYVIDDYWEKTGTLYDIAENPEHYEKEGYFIGAMSDIFTMLDKMEKEMDASMKQAAKDVEKIKQKIQKYKEKVIESDMVQDAEIHNFLLRIDNDMANEEEKNSIDIRIDKDKAKKLGLI